MSDCAMAFLLALTYWIKVRICCWSFRLISWHFRLARWIRM